MSDVHQSLPTFLLILSASMCRYKGAGPPGTFAASFQTTKDFTSAGFPQHRSFAHLESAIRRPRSSSAHRQTALPVSGDHARMEGSPFEITRPAEIFVHHAYLFTEWK
jgi:hypothetical protein